MNKNLTILLLYNPSSEIRGKMRRYFYEVKANVFVGTMSAGVRDTIWDHIEKTNTEASIIIHTTDEQGFMYKTTKKDTDYIFEDFNGIILPTSIDTNLRLNDLYAKTDYKLLDHILDVGYIAECLMTYGRAHTMAKSISNTMNLDFSIVVSSISWLCALHDIGKAHPHFVSKMYANSNNEKLIELYDSLKERNLVEDGNYSGFRHERFSRDVIKQYFTKNTYPIEAEQFADLIAYHHQGKNNNDFSDKIELKDAEWLCIHDRIIDIINNIWTFDREFSKNQNFVNGVNYSILSIMITADWIASGNKWRKLLEETPNKKECAKLFIEQNELLYVPMKDRFKDIGWSSVFSFEQNKLQQTAINASKECPQLMIIEYPCGGGKTEAAISAAIHMGKDKSGIFIATPTMSTAKGMSLRMNELAEKINLGMNIPEFDSSILWSNEDMNKIPSELWVSKSRHRMLYPFAVGTVDQILKTMLYYRYATIGLMGLSDKVLIIDEVHAYDSYMKTEIKSLLKWANFLDIPIILLSATLPSYTKVDLLKSIGYSKDEMPNSNEYPLITTYKNNECKCYPIECEGRKFKINVIHTKNYSETWRSEMKKNYNGCTAYIEGTVDNTWNLNNMAKELSLNPLMFSGRDTLSHKEQKTQLLLTKLGKNRENRPNKFTVTATSIIEQSLDIDLDRMFTCIAPIDLLIQRFGRVWRHSDVGTIREHESVDNPINIIISDNTTDWPDKIYGMPILQRTVEILEGLVEIDTVKDARRLIDYVYDDPNIIEKPPLIIKASFNLIKDPEKDNMLWNDNDKYSNFNVLQSSTRYETYPSISIAIVNPEDIIGIDNNYDIIRNIMQNNVVGISVFKSLDIKTTPIKFNHKLLNDVNFYYKDDLKKQNIELTEDGLKWSNN